MSNVYPEFEWETMKWASHKRLYWEKLLQGWEIKNKGDVYKF